MEILDKPNQRSPPLVEFLPAAFFVSSVRSISPPQNDSLSYLAAVLRGEIVSKGDLGALGTNVVVMQILDAARESARTGKTVRLTTLEE
jgi:hypothetical protein